MLVILGSKGEAGNSEGFVTSPHIQVVRYGITMQYTLCTVGGEVCYDTDNKAYSRFSEGGEDGVSGRLFKNCSDTMRI